MTYIKSTDAKAWKVVIYGWTPNMKDDVEKKHLKCTIEEDDFEDESSNQDDFKVWGLFWIKTFEMGIETNPWTNKKFTNWGTGNLTSTIETKFQSMIYLRWRWDPEALATSKPKDHL